MSAQPAPPPPLDDDAPSARTPSPAAPASPGPGPALPADQLPDEALPAPVSLARTLARPALLLLGLVAAGLCLRLLPPGTQHRLLDRWVVGRGLPGQAAFVGAAALLCAAGLPRQVAAFAGGYAFGLWGGIALSLAAMLGGCAADFLWARAVARRWARRRLRGRWARLNGFLAANPFTATLTLRLLPVGSNVLLNLLGGASAVPALPFLAASLLGYVPQTVVFALLGGGVRLGRGVQLALGALLFLGSALGGVALLRRARRAGRQALLPEGLILAAPGSDR